jgi:peptidoglycan/xylan/chitin deacetylase (PgdA/CDA1 family)
MKATACFTFDHLGDIAPFFHVLDRHGVRSSFFVQGEYGVTDPAGVAAIAERGHELGMHGWAHERWSELAPADEDALAARATDALTKANGGVPPTGFRAPAGARTEHTAEVLTRLGYRYDASLGDGMQPAVLAPALAQVPFVWGGVDGAFYLRPEPAEPSEVRGQWLEQLDKVADEGGLFLTICHAEITGADQARVAVLDDVMGAAVADDRVRIATAGELAAEVLAAHG